MLSDVNFRRVQPAAVSDETDWLERSTAPGVFRAFHFNDSSQLGEEWTLTAGAGTETGYGWNAGAGTNASDPTIDSGVSVTGGGALRLTLNSQTGEGGAGSWRMFFNEDGTLSFGENTELWAQFRYRCNAGWLEAAAQNDGTKLCDFGNGSEDPAIVLQTLQNFTTYPHLYTGGQGFQLREGLELQNGVGCAPLNGPEGCFALEADEWVTFKFHLDIGAKRAGGTHWDARVRLWAKRYGEESLLLVDYGPGTPGYDTNSPDGFPCSENPDGYGMFILFCFTTGKDNTDVHATSHCWYDELILSTQEIADPIDVQ